MPDFIPSQDDEFANFAPIFAAWVAANGLTRGLVAAQLTALATTNTIWGYAWTGFQNAETAYHAAKQDKDAKRASLEAMIRDLTAIIQKNPATTDVDRANAHITVPSGTRTPSTTPDTTPMLQKADVSTRGIIRLFIADSTNPDSLAKPSNARAVEIWEQIGGTAPTNPETMHYLGAESRQPYRADFEATDVGKPVWFAFRWMGKNNEPGPWSTFYQQIIPG